MSTVRGDDVTSDAAAFHHGAPGRISDFEGAADHLGADDREDPSRTKVEQRMHQRKAVLRAQRHFLEFNIGGGLEADRGSSASKKEISVRVCASADGRALLKNLPFCQTVERDAVVGILARPKDGSCYGIGRGRMVSDWRWWRRWFPRLLGAADRGKGQHENCQCHAASAFAYFGN